MYNPTRRTHLLHSSFCLDPSVCRKIVLLVVAVLPTPPVPFLFLVVFDQPFSLAEFLAIDLVATATSRGIVLPLSCWWALRYHYSFLLPYVVHFRDDDILLDHPPFDSSFLNFSISCTLHRRNASCIPGYCLPWQVMRNRAKLLRECRQVSCLAWVEGRHEQRINHQRETNSLLVAHTLLNKGGAAWSITMVSEKMHCFGAKNKSKKKLTQVFIFILVFSHVHCEFATAWLEVVYHDEKV